jgi:hypothetical protein
VRIDVWDKGKDKDISIENRVENGVKTAIPRNIEKSKAAGGFVQ